MSPQPRTIGNYEILSELGRGAMGVVYHAHDPGIGRTVAIKVIRVDSASNAEDSAQLRQRLVREASAAGGLSHPGIVTVYQLGENGQDVFVVMEYVAGASLEKVMSGNARLDPRHVLEILRQVAAALDYAHQAGIVHRDIKPANILVRHDGHVKIVDFGIAKTLQGAGATMTATGASLGSPAYMSPEQVRGENVNARSDQFSLAVMAYQMFAGRMPFVADTAHGMMYQIVAVDPFAAPRPDIQLDPRLVPALRQALAKNPNDRFPGCAAFVDELRRAYGLDPAATGQATVRRVPPHELARGSSEYTTAPQAVGHQAQADIAPAVPSKRQIVRGVWLGSAAGFVAVVLIAFYTLRAKPEPGRPEPARPEPARSEPARSEPARPEPARPSAVAPPSTVNLEGRWNADVKYSWGDKHPEVFDFKVDGNEVFGSASYVRGPRAIIDGKLDGAKLTFLTKSQTMLGDKTFEEKHHYRGRVKGDTIEFLLQTDSGYDDRPPETFTARRTTPAGVPR